jgi:hypothetical protein
MLHRVLDLALNPICSGAYSMLFRGVSVCIPAYTEASHVAPRT